MGKLSYSMMTTLDGFVDGPGSDLSWALIDEEIHRFVNERERPVSTCLYGRKMYEMMSFWQTPEAVTNNPEWEVEFAHLWRGQRKLVFSRTLQAVAGNSMLERAFDAEAMGQLKAATPGELSVSGPTLASQFIGAGLVDEISCYQHPVAIGKGTPFLQDIGSRIELRPLEEHRFASGVVFLRYAAGN